MLIFPVVLSLGFLIYAEMSDARSGSHLSYGPLPLGAGFLNVNELGNFFLKRLLNKSNPQRSI